jgi:hypothetical protein
VKNMSFRSLEDTYIFQNLNKNGAISANIGKILQHGTVLSQKNLEEAFMIINKNFKFPLKYKVLDQVNTHDIVLMFSPDNARLPTCMPFFLTRDKSGKIVAIVIVDMYGTMDKETGNINIDAKKLYCMMESAYLSKLCFMNGSQVATRNVIITNGSAIYANMFTRVLNKKYALNVDKSKMHKVLFLASKFFMINILGAPDNEMTNNYAMRNCLNGNPFVLKEISDMLKPEDYKDFASFIQALTKPELNLGMGDLAVRTYLENYIHMYESSALLALVSFPYFLYNVISVTDGAYINNQYILEDIVDNNGTKIYADLMNLDR